MRIFISHAWEDKPLALELAKLPDFIDAWVDIRELLPGELLDQTIVRAIEDAHVFVVLASHVSLAKAWIAKETAWALQRESQTNRVFVLPVLLDAGIDFKACRPPFDGFGERLFIQVPSRDEAGIAAARERIAHTLFHWLSDWIEVVEPRGDAAQRFVERLEADFVEFNERLHQVKAMLSWPIAAISSDEIFPKFIEAKDGYNAFTEAFIPRLASVDDELRRRFGPAAQKGFLQLVAFLRERVYHGAAYALNDVIDSLNEYDLRLSKDPQALAAADAQREERVKALEAPMAELVRRTSDFIGTLR